MTDEKLKMIEHREAEAPDEDELHLRADGLEKAHGLGESIAIDDACATLRAMAQSLNDRNVPDLCAAVRERDATIAKLEADLHEAWRSKSACVKKCAEHGKARLEDERRAQKGLETVRKKYQAEIAKLRGAIKEFRDALAGDESLCVFAEILTRALGEVPS